MFSFRRRKLRIQSSEIPNDQRCNEKKWLEVFDEHRALLSQPQNRHVGIFFVRPHFSCRPIERNGKSAHRNVTRAISVVSVTLIRVDMQEEKKNDDIDSLVQETSKLSIESENTPIPPGGPIVYTSAELDAIQSVYDKLTNDEKMDPSRIGLRALALTTIVSKLRVDEAVAKFKKFYAALETCDIQSLSFSDTEIDATLSDSAVTNKLDAYAPCGTDFEGRSVMWICGSSERLPGEEGVSTKAGVLYWLALHADERSLREGITFCIDLSKKKEMSKHGNEKKLRRMDQSYPLRPQSIMIAGASTVMRVSINVLIKIASVFSSQKILDRIEFVTVNKAFQSLPKASAPIYLGGGGGGINDVINWISQRFASFPIPDIKK